MKRIYRVSLKRIITLLTLPIMLFVFTSCMYAGVTAGDGNQDTISLTGNTSHVVLDAGPVKGGILKLFSTPPDTFNPLLTSNTYATDFLGLIYESLVKTGKDQRPVPWLSDRWEVSDDGLIWTFHIRDGVLWHDKVPLTPGDVEYTFKRITDPKLNTVYKNRLQNITGFAAINRSNLKIILRKPDSFTAELMTFPILPEHLRGNKDIIEAFKSMKPVGTGPYVFNTYEEKKYIKLTANESWWYSSVNKDDNKPVKPFIDTIDIKIGNSSAEAMNYFQTREIDAVRIGNDECSRYDGRADLTRIKYPSRNFDFLAFNLTKPVLKDKNVRQAIAYAINKQKIINDVLPGKAITADLPILPDSWLNSGGGAGSYDFDEARAKEILIQDGWKLQNGIMYNKVNDIKTPLRFELAVNEGNETRKKVAEYIAGVLKNIGADVRVTVLKWEDELSAVNSGKYDIALIGCAIREIPDISFLYSAGYFPANPSPGQTVAWNIAGYDNPAVADYINRIFSENDDNKKKALFLNMKEIINEDVPYIGLFFYNNAILYNKRLRGDLAPYEWNKYNDITGWYIP